MVVKRVGHEQAKQRTSSMKKSSKLSPSFLKESMPGRAQSMDGFVGCSQRHGIDEGWQGEGAVGTTSSTMTALLFSTSATWTSLA